MITAAVVALVPIIIGILARFSPPPEIAEGETFESLKERNGLISNIAQAFSFLGLAFPLVLFRRGINDIGWPALGLGFGLMAVLPIVWICIATLPLGIQRFKEFWRFTEIHQKLGLGAVLMIYSPLAIVGLVSVVILCNRADKVVSVVKSVW
jgi:hypothetical protein